MRYDFDKVIDRRKTASLKWDTGNQELLPMWVADMDFTVSEEIVKALEKRVQHGIFGYSIQDEAYYNAIIGWYGRKHGYTIEKEWILHSPGLVAGLHFIVQTFTRKEDKVLVLAPSYYQFYKSAEDNGRELVYCPLVKVDNHYAVDFALFESLAKREDVRMFVLSNPHNPGGRCWTKEELEKMGEICLQNNVLFVSDEIHCDLTLDGRSYQPVGALRREIVDNAIICNAPSKTFNLAGLQTGCMIVSNPELRQKLAAHIVTLGIKRPNVFGMTAMIAAYDKGEEWLTELQAYLTGNYHYMVEYLQENIPEFVPMQMDATYLAWVDVSALGGVPGQYHKYLEEVGKLWLDGGSMFGKEGENYERINFACSRTVLKDALERMKSAADVMRRDLKKNET